MTNPATAIVFSAALLCASWGSAACTSGPILAEAQSDEDALVSGERGLPVSASAPSFMPFHVTGPHEGKRACPLCVYGLGPQLQIWLEESKLSSVSAFVKEIDRLALQHPLEPAHKKDGFTPYLVVSSAKGGQLTPASVKLIKSWKLKRVFAASVPRWDDSETAKLYGHSTKDRPASRAYLVINRRVFKRWDNLGQAKAVATALGEGRRHVSTYDLVDSQIAPAWEPGQRLIVRFRVIGADGKPLAKQKVSASQTDRTGLYNPPGWNRRAPTLATSAWTDEEGWITFDTIYPGPYPREPEPSHIHFSTLVEGKAAFRTLWFEGDPHLTRERRAWADKDQETLIVKIDRKSNPWRVEHTFVID